MSRAALFVSLATVTSACSLLTSLDGYTGGTAADAGPTDATVAPADAGSDADASSDPLAAGLVAWWRFDEPSGPTAEDSSGHGHAGLLQKGAGRVAGHSGTAVDLDGVADDVAVGESPELTLPTAMTVTMWLRTSVVTAQPRMISHGDAWNVKLNGPQVQLTVGTAYSISNVSLTANDWHHVAVVFDRGAVTYYVEGVKTSIGTNTFTGKETLVADPNGIHIGSLSGTDGFFKGQLDEVRLYGRALTADEIGALAK